MGIPIKGASQVLCDNKSVVLSTSVPSSTLKKKHNALAYQWVREAVAVGIVKVSCIAGTEHVADVLTKPTMMDQHSGSTSSQLWLYCK